MPLYRFVVLFSLCVISTSLASLRVRYSWPKNHDPNAKETGNPLTYDPNWWAKMEPGVWDGYDQTTGFDTMSIENLGSFSNAPNVSASYWVDSLFEDRNDASFVSNCASQSDLLNPSYRLSGDGYCVLVYGQITFPVQGEYQFFTCGDDGGLRVWIDFNNNGIIDNDDELVGQDVTLENSPVPTALGANLFKNGKQLTKTVPAGKYKIRAWKWDWGEVSNGALFWKKPGSQNYETIPASMFGQRKNYGLPVAHVISIKAGDQAVPSAQWSFLELSNCTPLVFTASADNMNGVAPVYIWEFGNGCPPETTTTATAQTVFTNKPDQFALYSPTVRVLKGKTISAASSDVIVIMQSAICQIGCEGPVSNVAQQRMSITAQRASSRIIVSNPDGKAVLLKVYDLRGAEVYSGIDRSGSHELVIDPDKLAMSKGRYVLAIGYNGSTTTVVPFVTVDNLR